MTFDLLLTHCVSKQSRCNIVASKCATNGRNMMALLGKAAHRSCGLYRQGAEAFGWDKRNPEPGSMRDGTELVGWGMPTGVWEALQVPIAVRTMLTANGRAEVSCATSDIGTGTYTIMAQVTADMMGLPLDNVTIKLGDSTLPQSPVEGGSWIAPRCRMGS
jgi:CO/xanthine dehydrogenase Mo-binding subunit